MLLRPIRAALRHVAVLGNALPRQCGLATYTSHSVAALRSAFPAIRIDHLAMDDGSGVIYGDDVAATIDASDVTAYVRAATSIQRSGAQLLWLHHEFGIFGGAAGDHLLALLRHIDIPLVVTLHTVLRTPDADQMRVMRALIGRADRLIVMAQAAADILAEVYEVDPDRIDLIRHGAPDRALCPTLPFKQRLGLGAGPIMLTFGLLSPGKGLDVAIRALPEIVTRHPDLSYVIAGATHPTLLRQEGERYRETLIALVEQLGLQDHVRFVDRFLDDEELLDHLQAADLYVTPYLGREQVTSGTLSYALAMGKPVISTPYIHAEEALADGIGTLVPFGDAAAISAAVIDHLADPAQLEAQARVVWQDARRTIWAENARAVMKILSEAKASRPAMLRESSPVGTSDRVQLAGLAAMTDDVGIIQHSVKGIPDRRHGYCVDDNARALMLVCATRAGDPADRQRLALIYAAFLEHAWNGEAGRFRNFMGFDRRWLEDTGSEDSNGRCLWTLGSVVRTAPEDFMRDWAIGLFNRALQLAAGLHSPRAQAFAVLGMASVLEVEPGHAQCRSGIRATLDLFKTLWARASRGDWIWFESVLAYDNARLSQAMIEGGRAVGDEEAIELGCATLTWLIARQCAPDGYFRPIGTESFGEPYGASRPFDQQPLEASATIDACLSAHRARSESAWIAAADSAYRWFEGDNDLGASLATADGTLCHDGLTPLGVNLNIGAESLLALQMARHAMGELARTDGDMPQLAVV